MNERIIKAIIPISVSRTQIITEVKVAPPNKSKIILAKTLWDTGSSYSSITNRVVEVLSLEETNSTSVINSSEIREAKTFSAILCIEELGWAGEYNTLPANNFIEGQSHNVIIGMGIISLGKLSNERLDLLTDYSDFGIIVFMPKKILSRRLLEIVEQLPKRVQEFGIIKFELIIVSRTT